MLFMAWNLARFWNLVRSCGPLAPHIHLPLLHMSVPLRVDMWSSPTPAAERWRKRYQDTEKHVAAKKTQPKWLKASAWNWYYIWYWCASPWYLDRVVFCCAHFIPEDKTCDDSAVCVGPVQKHLHSLHYQRRWGGGGGERAFFLWCNCHAEKLVLQEAAITYCRVDAKDWGGGSELNDTVMLSMTKAVLFVNIPLENYTRLPFPLPCPSEVDRSRQPPKAF